jgi:hypothetical protein
LSAFRHVREAATDVDETTRLLNDAGERVEQRGLPGAIGAYQSHHFARCNLQRCAIERRRRAIADHEVLDFDHAHGASTDPR